MLNGYASVYQSEIELCLDLYRAEPLCVDGPPGLVTPAAVHKSLKRRVDGNCTSAVGQRPQFHADALPTPSRSRRNKQKILTRNRV